jgi:hypothetical protein
MQHAVIYWGEHTTLVRCTSIPMQGAAHLRRRKANHSLYETNPTTTPLPKHGMLIDPKRRFSRRQENSHQFGSSRPRKYNFSSFLFISVTVALLIASFGKQSIKNTRKYTYKLSFMQELSVYTFFSNRTSLIVSSCCFNL